MPPTYQGSRVAEDGRGAVGGISRARSPDYAHDHSIYYPHPTWNRTTAPLPNPPYIPTGNDNWHNPIPHDHSHSDPHNNSQIINEEGTFVHHRNHHPPSSIPAGASAFTPINQYYNPVPYPFPQYRTPYAGNDIPLLGPQNKRPLQPKEFRNVGPRDFEEPRRPQKRRWRI